MAFLLALYIGLTLKLISDFKDPQRRKVLGYLQNTFQLVVYVMMIYLCLCSLARVEIMRRNRGEVFLVKDNIVNKVKSLWKH